MKNMFTYFIPAAATIQYICSFSTTMLCACPTSTEDPSKIVHDARCLVTLLGDHTTRLHRDLNSVKLSVESLTTKVDTNSAVLDQHAKVQTSLYSRIATLETEVRSSTSAAAPDLEEVEVKRYFSVHFKRFS